MKEFYVTIRVDARYVTKVEADTVEEALRMANDHFANADFCEAENVRGKPIIVEEANGNQVWRKE